MKAITSLSRFARLCPSRAALLFGLGLALASASLDGAVLPPSSKPYGKTYGEWSAVWWQWALSQPVEAHPFIDDPAFDVTSGQSGSVWFLGTPFGTVTRSVTIPSGKALLIGLLNA